MANTKYSVTHPDGTVSTRSSARSYTFAVVAVPATQEARRQALNKRADELLARADQMDVAADAGQVTRRYRGVGINPTAFHAYDVDLKGTEVRGNRVTYCEINTRANDENLHETWRRYVPEGVEVVRETTADHNNEKMVAVPVKDYLVGTARQRAAELRESAAKLRAEGDKPDSKGYEALRWSSRRDLAMKALSEFDHEIAVGRTLAIVPVDKA